MKKIGEIVREYRESKDMGEKEFAASISRSITFLWKLETGITHKPFRRSMQRIFEVYPEIRKRLLKESIPQPQ